LNDLELLRATVPLYRSSLAPVRTLLVSERFGITRVGMTALIKGTQSHARTNTHGPIHPGWESRRDEITKAQGEALGIEASPQFGSPVGASPVSPLQGFPLRSSIYPGRCPGLWLSRPFGTPDRDAEIGSLARRYSTNHTTDRVVHMRDGQVQKVEVNPARLAPEDLEW
jgi:hypothetical protein